MKTPIFATIFAVLAIFTLNFQITESGPATGATTAGVKEETQEQLNKRLDKALGITPTDPTGAAATKARKRTPAETKRIEDILKGWDD